MCSTVTGYVYALCQMVKKKKQQTKGKSEAGKE